MNKSMLNAIRFSLNVRIALGITGGVLLCLLVLTGCSTTANIPDDDQLFTGLTKIDYQNYEKNDNFITTREEIDAALATAPNGALFGSSYYRTPFPYGLWIWNAYSKSETGFGRWMTKAFGKPPVLMSMVNPALRASVAQSVLRNHGYFHGKVSYSAVAQKNPKKSKIGYTVDMGPLFVVDSMSYVGFPATADSLITATADEALIRKGDPFTVSGLDAERSRLSSLFRNNGYYYYQPGYASYLADTLQVPGHAQLRLQLADEIPPQATRQWYIGRVRLDIRRSFMEQPTDSLVRRSLTVRYTGDKPKLRPRVILGGMRLRRRQLFNYDNYMQTVSNINAMGLFSMVDFSFTPRDTTATCDTLDLAINCILDKPYDTYIETNFVNRTVGRMGPELRLGLTKRNAFRGGEKLDINLHGSYEWQTGKNSSGMNTYEYGADASLEFPRIVAPFFGGNRVRRPRTDSRAGGQQPARPRRRRFYTTPSTLAKASTNIISRPGYYKMHVVSGEWTYRWQTSESSRHEFSPLTVKYQFMNSHTADFDTLMAENPYMLTMVSDHFVPEMRYTYTYTSPAGIQNPIRWEITLSEAGNLLSLGYLAAGHKWNEKNKKMFKNPYSQFVRAETDFTKTWTLSPYSRVVGHVNAGFVYTYGNSSTAIFSERYYAGGANSVRAFPVRTLGPGNFEPLADLSNKESRLLSYLMQNGQIRFVANLEYRTRLFGNLHGALFLDAGNVWDFRRDYGSDELNERQEGQVFKLKNLPRQLALGTGVGLRYDLDFLVLRLDWGIGLHAPYDTGRSGYFNVNPFRDARTIHFAIGYPF